jgi:ubiquinol-cytochrome c reductase cytochrome c subunit
VRKLFTHRLLLPGAVLGIVGISGFLTFGPGAASSAATTSSGSSSTTASPTTADATAAAASSGLPALNTLNQVGVTQAFNSGGPNSSVQKYSNGNLVAYGNSAIVYVAPPASDVPAGEALFSEFCSSCHGSSAEGTAAAPNLVGVGPATVDFWITTGRMPAKGPYGTQAPSKPRALTDQEALEVAAYVNSLAPATPFVPNVNTKSADLAVGADLFALNCAACHTITGAGDALAKDTYAPTLHQATATQVAEAIRTGPGNMPRFTGNLTDNQVRDLTAYVTEKIQHPSNPGGFGLGGIGPVAEGFVALLFGVGALMLVCFWIGDRT